jgi:hypothetical protein
VQHGRRELVPLPLEKKEGLAEEARQGAGAHEVKTCTGMFRRKCTGTERRLAERKHAQVWVEEKVRSYRAQAHRERSCAGLNLECAERRLEEG